MKTEKIFHSQVISQFETSSLQDQKRILLCVDLLDEFGANLGRPYVDHVKGSSIRNLKELRVGGRLQIRILFVFDKQQRILFLFAGSKRGKGSKWYLRAVLQAEKHYLQLTQT